MPGILRVYLENPGYTWKIPCDRLGIVPISSILPQILPQTSSQTQGNSRVSRMEHQTPSVFPGNFRKRKVLGTLCFPFCLPEKYMQAKGWPNQVCIIFAWGGPHAEILQKPDRPLPCPYLPTYLPTLLMGN